MTDNTHPDWLDDDGRLEQDRELILDEYEQHLDHVYLEELERLADHGA